MSFGVYRPAMGVAGGHRETVSNQSLLKQRQMGEQMRRQEINPITGEPIGTPIGTPNGRPPSGSRKPKGNLGVGLVPSGGPLDYMRPDHPEKDVPLKRVDPTKNQTTSFHSGVACLAHEDNRPPRAQPSRITESSFERGEGLFERAPTPDRSGNRSGSLSRRSTPGQVVRTNMRPKDSLSGCACITSDKYDPSMPLNLPRQAGSAGPGVGSGGSCHILQGPNGFVPLGPEDMMDMPMPAAAPAARGRPFQRACGVAAVMGA